MQGNDCPTGPTSLGLPWSNIKVALVMQFEQVGTKSLNCSGFAMNDNERPLFNITKNKVGET